MSLLRRSCGGSGQLRGGDGFKPGTLKGRHSPVCTPYKGHCLVFLGRRCPKPSKRSYLTRSKATGKLSPHSPTLSNLTAKPTIISTFQRRATNDRCACHYSHIFALLLKSELEWQVVSNAGMPIYVKRVMRWSPT